MGRVEIYSKQISEKFDNAEKEQIKSDIEQFCELEYIQSDKAIRIVKKVEKISDNNGDTARNKIKSEFRRQIGDSARTVHGTTQSVRESLFDVSMSHKTTTNSKSDTSSNKSDTTYQKKDNYSSQWDELRKQAYERDEYQCQNCGIGGGPKGDAELHAHHIVPKGVGGNHVLSNLSTLCADCHGLIHEHLD